MKKLSKSIFSVTVIMVITIIQTGIISIEIENSRPANKHNKPYSFQTTKQFR
jgi:hypothetical protein